MFGLLTMMSGLLGIAAVVSYWISWDMQPKDGRSSFRAKASNDLRNLLRRRRIHVPGDRHQPKLTSPGVLRP